MSNDPAPVRDGGRPDPGAPVLAYRTPPGRAQRNPADLLLGAGTAVYLLLNLAGVVAAIEGLIFPPWPVLAVFTFCPAALVILVAVLRVFVRFSVPVLVVFVVLMAFAGVSNLVFFGTAMAQV